jgi:hypothetical protein
MACHCLSQVDWALDLSQSLGARHQPPDGGAPVAAAATPEPVGRRQHGWIRVLGDHAADHEPQQAAPRPHHIHAARPPPLVPTGVGGDNGIDHVKNWLRSTFLHFFDPIISTHTRTSFGMAACVVATRELTGGCRVACVRRGGSRCRWICPCSRRRCRDRTCRAWPRCRGSGSCTTAAGGLWGGRRRPRSLSGRWRRRHRRNCRGRHRPIISGITRLSIRAALEAAGPPLPLCGHRAWPRRRDSQS